MGEAEVPAYRGHHREDRGAHQRPVAQVANVQLHMGSLDPDQGVQPVGLAPGEPLPQLVGIQGVGAAGVAGQVERRRQMRGRHRCGWHGRRVVNRTWSHLTRRSDRQPRPRSPRTRPSPGLHRRWTRPAGRAGVRRRRKGARQSHLYRVMSGRNAGAGSRAGAAGVPRCWLLPWRGERVRWATSLGRNGSPLLATEDELGAEVELGGVVVVRGDRVRDEELREMGVVARQDLLQDALREPGGLVLGSGRRGSAAVGRSRRCSCRSARRLGPPWSPRSRPAGGFR